MPKNYAYLTKAEERVLLRHLELYYAHLLHRYKLLEAYKFASLSVRNRAEKKLMFTIRSTERILKTLNSKLV